MAYKYFLYSTQQLNFKKDREKTLGRKFKMGYVLVNGVKKNITEINTTGISRFPDAKIIAEGEAKEMRYSEPSHY